MAPHSYISGLLFYILGVAKGFIFRKNIGDSLCQKIIEQQTEQIIEHQGDYIPTGTAISNKIVGLAVRHNLKLKHFLHPTFILQSIYNSIDDEKRLPKKIEILKKLQEEIDKSMHIDSKALEEGFRELSGKRVNLLLRDRNKFIITQILNLIIFILALNLLYILYPLDSPIFILGILVGAIVYLEKRGYFYELEMLIKWSTIENGVRNSQDLKRVRGILDRRYVHLHVLSTSIIRFTKDLNDDDIIYITTESSLRSLLVLLFNIRAIRGLTNNKIYIKGSGLNWLIRLINHKVCIYNSIEDL